MTPRICIFASGAGTNAEKIIQHFQNGKVATVALVLTNRPDAKVIERAKSMNVSCEIFSKTDLMEGEVENILTRHQITHLVLAGFLLQVPVSLIQSFHHRIINIHPSLLPKFGGKGMYGIKVHEAVKAAGETTTGITIHEVDEHYDEGRILFQASVAVLPSDSPEEIATKVHELEYAHYPRVIENWIAKT